jgi:uncharacterized protein (DUF169 family)
MKSRTADALHLKYQPVCILWTDDMPDGAMGFKHGRWGCVMWMLASAAKGKTAAFDEDTCGCWGGGVGLGFGNQYLNFPGGVECFYHFLSSGNDAWEKGRDTAKMLESAAGRDFLEEFCRGEGYMKSPEMVRRFVEGMPIMKIPKRYVVFKPLADLDPEKEQPQTVVFLADPDQLSALVVLANYGRGDGMNVIIPFAAGCQQIGIFPYREAQSASPRAVIGLTDISARKNIRKQLDRDLFTFAVPWGMFREMEENVEGSFLQKGAWKALLQS